ncbi:MAG TPA: DUF3089 domain-containing protein [Saprospiraceae bacterium]|nr:DUF3089 domain-containing protein [Saprospiraceae bacterium]
MHLKTKIEIFVLAILPFLKIASQSTVDYSQLEYWAAHPSKEDPSDTIPTGLVKSSFAPDADVFFLYPTSYYPRNRKQWNADLKDEKVNAITDEGSLHYQASCFNEVGKVYAPRYRQAHLDVFTTREKKQAKEALDLAYNDIKQAFEYYLEHFNQGRPIIIASHSQGALHAMRLLQDYFDQTNLKNRLVVAYLVGYPIPASAFKQLKACKSKMETSCICSWRTYEEGMDKTSIVKPQQELIITNPISWEISDRKTELSEHRGMIISDFDATKHKQCIQAQIYNNSILWINKPKFKGSWLYLSKNYHRGDINLFYLDIRENAKYRLNLFYK